MRRHGTHRGAAEASAALWVIGLSAGVALLRGSRVGAAMFCLCFCAIAAAALLGWPRRSLTVAGVGLACLVWLVTLDVLGHPGSGSAAAHAIAGALLGWALADGILRTPGARADAQRVVAAAVVATLAAGVVWEVWEWATDALAGTNLSAGIGDTALDLLADALGAAAGASLALPFSLARSVPTRS